MLLMPHLPWDGRPRPSLPVAEIASLGWTEACALNLVIV